MQAVVVVGLKEAIVGRFRYGDCNMRSQILLVGRIPELAGKSEVVHSFQMRDCFAMGVVHTDCLVQLQRCYDVHIFEHG